MMQSFFDTYNCMRSFTNYIEPRSYDEWYYLPEDHKAAVLFVQYFDEILLAWSKATTNHTFRGDDEEAVETALQYLIKNVPILNKDKNKFNARYIYRVMYNCMYCIVHDRLRDKFERECVISTTCVNDNGDEIDLFDYVIDYTQDPAKVYQANCFWNLLENLDTDAKALADKIIKSGKLPKRMGPETKKAFEKLKISLSIIVD